ncbi:MAG TPA: chlorophyll synthesis pathway protein BchC [Pseudomonadales bacterium]|nr:chlorophyll synthesis pathway protein BchC [Pseudomonadales bacterium]
MGASLDTLAVVLEQPEKLVLSRLQLDAPGADDLVVELEWSGISTGTERLLYTGAMPAFPGMGYPLVPGYESVARVVQSPERSAFEPGERVFVPGAACFGEVRGLFGGAASRLVVPARRVVPIGESVGEEGVLMALAATAFHALNTGETRCDGLPDLIVGHGVLGRLLARLTVALGGRAPVVWETNPQRRADARGYSCIDPADDDRHDYRHVYDVSGAPELLDKLISRLAKGGEVVLAGFYSAPLSFSFPPAFMREARLRIASEWQPGDLSAIVSLVDMGRLSLDGLVTHRSGATGAADAYRTAFEDSDCLKMILDWSNR